MGQYGSPWTPLKGLKSSVRYRTVTAGLGSSGLQRGQGHGVPRILDTHIPLEVLEKLKMESGSMGWIWPGLGLWGALAAPGLDSGRLELGGGCDSGFKEASYGRLDNASIDEGLLHGGS